MLGRLLFSAATVFAAAAFFSGGRIILPLPRRSLNHKSALSVFALAEQPVNSVALHGTVPRDRFLDFALVLQHLEELAALKVDVALTSLELALAALQVGLHTIGQLGGVEDLARVPHCGAVVL